MLEAAVSESESMVMEVVSAAVSGSEVAGNWMRMVYTASPWQSGNKGGLVEMTTKLNQYWLLSDTDVKIKELYRSVV